MTLRDAIISPQVAQGLIAGLFLMLGWIFTHALNIRRDNRQRDERITDVQRALLAEIRAHVVALERQADAGALTVPDQIGESVYLPILPHDANDRVFRAIVAEVHILPEWAIDPVVRYYRLLSVRAALAQDIRDSASTNPDRAAAMLGHYVLLNEETLETGIDAVEMLTEGLRGGDTAIRRLLNQRAGQAEAEVAAINRKYSDQKDR